MISFFSLEQRCRGRGVADGDVVIRALGFRSVLPAASPT